LGTGFAGLDEVDGLEERDGASACERLEGDEERVEGEDDPLFVRFDRVVRGVLEEPRDGLVRGLSELGRRSTLPDEPLEERRVERASLRGDGPSLRRLSKLPRPSELAWERPAPFERLSEGPSKVRLPDPLRPSLAGCLPVLVRELFFARVASCLARWFSTEGAANPIELPRGLSFDPDFILLDCSFDFLMESALANSSARGSPLDRFFGALALFTPASSRLGEATFRALLLPLPPLDGLAEVYGRVALAAFATSALSRMTVVCTWW
jgi:hypothetical protein